MATREQKSKAGKTDTATRVPGFWDKLNAFGEQHAKLIISVSTVLIILTVILFAKIFYDRTLAERAAKEISQANTVEKLKELKTKYGSKPLVAEIIYRLGNRYYEEGRLAEAKKEYEEFKSRFPTHPLWRFVNDAYTGLIKNLAFLEGEKDRRLKVRVLRTHPEDYRKKEDLEKLRGLRGLENAAFFFGPEKLEDPVARIEIEGKGAFTVRLFENEAPNTVYNFVKLVDQKAFDGLKCEKSGDIVRFSKKPEYFLKLEKNDREFKHFCLVLRKAADRDQQAAGAEFEILLNDQPDLKDAVVFGMVTEYTPVVQELTAESRIKTATVSTRRASTKYEPEITQP